MRLLKTVSVFLVTALMLSPSTALAKSKGDWYKRLDLSGGITSVYQSTIGNADKTTRTLDQANFSYSLNLMVESRLSDKQKIVVHFEAAEGEGIAQNLRDNSAVPPTSYSTISPDYNRYRAAYSNADGSVQQGLKTSEVYYEGLLFWDRAIVSLGKMDIHSLYDQNRLAGSETDQFLAGIFVTMAGTVFNELDNYYAPGYKINTAIASFLELSYVGAFQYENVGNSSFHVGQINLKPNLLGGEGNYRFYLVWDNRNYTLTSGGEKEANIGFGISLDQMITNDIGIFLRFASQPTKFEENRIKNGSAFGAHIGGAMWGRRKDHIGFGYGMVTNNKSISSPSSYSGQSVMELYYYMHLTKGVSITPDFQMHSNLERASNRTVMIAGARLQLDF